MEYQPALPIPNGKVWVWLFLSTEIMFFARLIGTYIVMRMGALGTWPAPHHVHLGDPLGVINTVVLISSSVSSCLRTRRDASTGRKPSWMFVTLVLGTLFLGIKGLNTTARSLTAFTRPMTA